VKSAILLPSEPNGVTDRYGKMDRPWLKLASHDRRRPKFSCPNPWHLLSESELGREAETDWRDGEQQLDQHEFGPPLAAVRLQELAWHS
jgi:hypothetical protein